MANNVCMSFLEKKTPEFQSKMQAALQSGDRTTMKYYQSLWMECTRKKGAIERACGSGSMTPEEYLAIQRNQVNKDANLLAYFQQTGDTKKAAIVSERLSATKQELIEMEGEGAEESKQQN